MITRIYVESKRYNERCQNLFDVGDIVKVSRCNTYSYGLIGEVIGIENHLYLVRFNVWHDEVDKILRFRGESLEHVEGVRNMVNNAVTGNYDIAWTKFLGAGPFDKEYVFALFDPEIRAGDHVLVEAAGEYKVVKVSSIVGRAVYNGTAPTKEVICKVDFSEYERRKKIREQKKILRRQMDELVSKNQELILYQAIAKDNPEMAAMLEEYKALGDEV